MEQNLERTFDLLDKWMELKRIPKEKQKKYYHQLIISLEKADAKLKEKLICFTTGGMAVSSGITLFLLRNDNFDFILAIFLLCYGAIVGTIPLKPEKEVNLQEDEEYGEIEKQRRIIKEKFEKRKD